MCSVFFKSVQACKLGSIMYRTKKKSSSLFSPSLHTISCIPSRSCFNSSVSPPESSYAVVLDFKQFWNISLGWECSLVEPNLFCLSRWALYMALSIGDHTAQCLEVRGKVRSLCAFLCTFLCVFVLSKKCQSWCTLYLLPFCLMSILNCGSSAKTTERKRQS